MGPSTIDWGKGAESFLVRKVREYPALWDTRNENYQDKTKEICGYNAICRAMKVRFPHLHMLTPDIVKCKFEDMRFYFARIINTEVKRPCQASNSQELGEFFHHMERFETERHTPFTSKALIHDPVSSKSENEIKPQVNQVSSESENEIFKPQVDIHEKINIKIEDLDIPLNDEDECSMSQGKDHLEVNSSESVANTVPQVPDCDDSSFMPGRKRMKRDVHPQIDLGQEANESSEGISQSKRTARMVEGILASFPPSVQLKMTVDIIQFIASRLPLYQNM